MRLLICAGGTGGGVYPALAVLRALIIGEGEPSISSDMNSPVKAKPMSHPIEVLWVGGIGGMEAELVSREGLRFEAIPAAGLHGVGLRQLPNNLLQVSKGVKAARRIIGGFRPEVMFFTGGYVAVPVAFAGRTPGLGTARPIHVLYVPDIEPGLALKTLGRFADHIVLTAEESMEFFPKRTDFTVTGYPTRRELKSWSLESARATLNLSSNLPTLLVFGGSKGARSINRALFGSLPELLVEMQVVHISGHLDWPEVETINSSLESSLRERYHPYPYLYGEMGAALTAADVVLSRAGASILGEYPLFGLPAILVPYPYAWRYQEVNARYLEKHGAAMVVSDGDLPKELLPVIRDLMGDSIRRKAMQQAMRSLARPAAAETIANLLWSLAPSPSLGRN